MRPHQDQGNRSFRGSRPPPSPPIQGIAVGVPNLNSEHFPVLRSVSGGPNVIPASPKTPIVPKAPPHGPGLSKSGNTIPVQASVPKSVVMQVSDQKDKALMSESASEEDDDTEDDDSGEDSCAPAKPPLSEPVDAPKVGEGIPKPKPKLFSDLFRDNRRPSVGNKLSGQSNIGVKPVLLEDDEDNVVDVWGFALVGYIAGKSLSKGAIIQMCNSWKVKYHVHFHDSGWIILKFDNESDKDKVLAEGPYVVFGRPFVVKDMPDGFAFDGAEVAKVPLWVRLPNLPLKFWNERALSKITAFFGTPLQTDKLTITRQKLSYARVLVEVDLSLEAVYNVEVELPKGRSLVQRIVYEYVPKYCKLCNSLDHCKADCKKDDKLSEVAAAPQQEHVAPAANGVPHAPVGPAAPDVAAPVMQGPAVTAGPVPPAVVAAERPRVAPVMQGPVVTAGPVPPAAVRVVAAERPRAVAAPVVQGPVVAAGPVPPAAVRVVAAERPRVVAAPAVQGPVTAGPPAAVRAVAAPAAPVSKQGPAAPVGPVPAPAAVPRELQVPPVCPGTGDPGDNPTRVASHNRPRGSCPRRDMHGDTANERPRVDTRGKKHRNGRNRKGPFMAPRA